MKVPLSSPDITQKEIDSVVNVLKTRHLSIGPKIIEFEKALSDYIGVSHAVGVNSGTSALHIMIKYLGITKGDEVITSPFSFIASSNAILFESGTPVFVDINPDTLNIDEDKIEEKITEKTKALIIVDIFGHPLDWDKILKISEKYNLPIIEDSCEALGAEYKGQKVGRFGVGGAFAFYPNKQITTGEGGIIVTDDDDLCDYARSLRNQGRSPSDSWLDHTRLGYNYRLNEMSAALGIVQMERIEEILNKRSAIAEKYNNRIKGIDGVEPLKVADYVTRMSWFVYIIKLAKDLDRDDILKKLNDLGVQSKPYFPPIHLQPFYRERFGYKEGDFPITEAISKRTIAIPFFNNISDDQIKYVCNLIQTTIKKYR
ncbi:DegT/DnrJ/EryC1/StrS family aminotransferase [Candidatus Dependentiae bacterium]|nr:DegT/DnrJ/EryC1/StrS family aminotransferase [Candidatus Dependentiae bacterium]